MFTFHKDDVSVFFFFSMMHVLVSYLKFMIILNILQFIHPLSFKKWKILTKKKKKKKMKNNNWLKSLWTRNEAGVSRVILKLNQPTDANQTVLPLSPTDWAEACDWMENPALTPMRCYHWNCNSKLSWLPNRPIWRYFVSFCRCFHVLCFV